jgi:hypothetical protein
MTEFRPVTEAHKPLRSMPQVVLDFLAGTDGDGC